MNSLINPKIYMGFLLLVSIVAQSQPEIQKLLPSSDEFWVINGPKVQKINEQGVILTDYHSHSLGVPTNIDTSDPFRVMIFYHQPQTLVILNSDGVAIGEPVSFTDLALGEVTLACRSSRGGAWLFHRESNELLLTNPQFTRIVQRTPIKTRYSPNCLKEANGLIYLGINNNSIQQLDSYGAKLNEFNILYDGYFMVDANFLWIIHNGLVEKRVIHDPVKIFDFFRCSCNTYPLIIKGEPKCLDGNKLITCEKITATGR